jgi:glyoxylase-like metal-dependent hydrolase (beta-lactamase superfamily II)
VIEVERIETAEQVVRLRVARRLPGLASYHTAAYWVDRLLVDTGCAHTAAQLVLALGELGVDQVVNTHSHEDHIGANARVQERFGCPVLAHPDALPTLENPGLQKLQLYRRLYWGRPTAASCQAVGEWVETRRFRFQVIHTPGHSPDHICLFEAGQGWLFSGDAYIGGEDRALREGYDIYGIISSLRTLAALPVQTIFSGSGSVRTQGAQHLRAKIDYLEDLGRRIRSLEEEGLSPRRIRARLLGAEPAISYLTLGHFSGSRLVRSYLTRPVLENAES